MVWRMPMTLAGTGVPGDLGADVGDGGGGAAGEDQPGGDGFGRRVPGSEEDHGGNRADAVGAGELGD